MQESCQQPIAIIGAGSWGTALALSLARREQQVRLWSYNTAQAAEMQAKRENRKYLPGFPFPETVSVSAHLKETMAGLNDIMIAVPSVGFRTTLMQLKPLLNSSARIAWATKGMDLETGQWLHEVAQEVLGNQFPYAILSGPSFAKEVAANLPTAVVVASRNEKFAKDLLQRFNSQTFRIYLSKDMLGVEVGGVVKNILAIATGISDGMGFGANTRSALMTRGLAEMIRFGLAVGAQYETFTGLSGFGDLVLTCTDNQSRNRRFGLALGKGKTSTEAELEIGQVVEGKRNAELLIQRAQKLKVEMPISETVWAILQGKITPKEAMKNLLTRAPKME